MTDLDNQMKRENELMNASAPLNMQGLKVGNSGDNAVSTENHKVQNSHSIQNFPGMQDQIKQMDLIDSLNFNKHLLVNNTFENTLVNTIGTIGDSIVDNHSNTQEKMTKTTKNGEGAY